LLAAALFVLGCIVASFQMQVAGFLGRNMRFLVIQRWKILPVAVTIVGLLIGLAVDLQVNSDGANSAEPTGAKKASATPAAEEGQTTPAERSYPSNTTLGGVELDASVVNVSQGADNWSSKAAAQYNEVVAAQIVYDDKDAPSTAITVALETSQRMSTTQKVRWHVSIGNQTTIVETPVKLNRSDGFLTYIPGTARWRRNPSNTSLAPLITTHLPDQQILAPSEPLDTLQNKYDNAGSIQVQFRVFISGTQVDTRGKNLQNGMVSNPVHIKAGSQMEILGSVQNTGNTNHYGTSLSFVLPSGFSVTGTHLSIKRKDFKGATTTESVEAIASGAVIKVALGTLAPGDTDTLVLHVQGAKDPAPTPSRVQITTQSSAFNSYYYYNYLDIFCRPVIHSVQEGGSVEP
jgi:hypothetical protein